MDSSRIINDQLILEEAYDENYVPTEEGEHQRVNLLIHNPNKELIWTGLYLN